ncbi:hypothetical protein DKX38_002341 [Salix brachista]|uniref:BTB domain-containing protein n=1 Tax=Salix brachista TaxID=2182728 RepID=A0A5N5NNQ1_9ROSI|nr:hypothetical protein DKX38_002341 [Salix brachista]
MRGHRSTASRVDTEGETDSDSETMRCISCKEYYGRCDAGTCKECYEEASDTEEELKREIEDLKAKVAFLRFWSPLDHHITHRSSAGPCFTDASRSPVFKAMLENEMEESRSGTIKISDVSYDALRSFVNYMYTAEACLDEQMACDLLVLAEKYQVKHLKAYCEKFLVSKLNWDNSVVSYAFAHQHNAKHMLETALSLITDNMDKLTKREEYIELVEKDPRLVVEIYEAYLSKQVNTAAHKDSSSMKP